MALEEREWLLGYAYDLLFDLKTSTQLNNEVEYLAHRLKGIADLCRQDKHPIDTYILTVLDIPKGD